MVPHQKMNTTQTAYQKTSEQILLECKERCNGPAVCPFRGYIPRPDNPIVCIRCDIYARFRKQQEINARLQEMLPRRYWECTLDNYDPTTEEQAEALDVAKHYVHMREWEQGTNILFLGNCGAGKTHLAAAIVKEAMQQGAVVLFVMAQDLQKFTDEEKLLKTVDVLAIDDLADEVMDVDALRLFYRIVNHRTADGKSIILTTNFTPEALTRRLGAKAVDRLLGNTKVVFFQKTPSYRTLPEKRKSGTQAQAKSN